ncbi:hypothetical protein C7458_10829 [Williamsia muralis]|nr:hypothetical protein C7458_10829 [Williamsia marianensis]
MGIREFILARIEEDAEVASSDRDHREVAAKRVVVNQFDSAGYDPAMRYGSFNVSGVGRVGWIPPPPQIICAIAAVYSDHDDFDPTWAAIAKRKPRT